MIIGMKKLSLFALSEDKEKILNSLIRLGCLELITSELKDYDDIKDIVIKDSSDLKEQNDSLFEINSALKTLNKYAPVKSGLFKNRHLVKDGEFNSKSAVKNALEASQKINTFAREINECLNEENKLSANKTALLPYINCDIPLNFEGTKETAFLFGTCPVYINTDELVYTLPQNLLCHIEIISSDKLQHYIAVLVHKSSFDDVMAALKEFEFTRALLSTTDEAPKEAVKNIEIALKELEDKRNNIKDRLSSYNEKRIDIEKCYDAVNIEVEREKMKDSLLKTEKTFFLTGWVSEDLSDKAEKCLQGYNCAYEFKEPDADEKPPVKIKNSSLVDPFGAITKLYSLPDPDGIDPNPFMAPFFFMFFGIMISDAGYGLLMTIGSFIIMKKYRLHGMTRQFIHLAFLGGISTIIWGAMFGSWFGDIIPVVTKMLIGREIIIKPLWFNPLEDPMTMLFFAFALGLIHIFSGMALNAYQLIKKGKWLDALFDVGFWYLLIIGLLIMAVNFEIGKYMSLAGAVGLVLTQGRSNKNIFKKLTSGVLSLYNITAYFSDVLSYSRLLALGLATGVIASVINTMGSLLKGNIFGIIFMIAIFIGGHLFNLAINALGSYVHTSRLQYIEFFGKFYLSGGKEYSPSYMKTKYVDIIKEEK